MALGYELNARMALEKHGFRFSHKLGQNFILDEALIGRIVDAAGVGAGDAVLEIGPGAGTMTAEMAMRGAQVLALELDGALEPVLQEVLSGYPGARVEFVDALKADLPALCTQHLGRPFQVVANLPYYITADVVLKLLRSELMLTRITIMVQKEAAERMMAHPGEKAYCALAATVQYYGVPSVLMELPPDVFTPRPHVDSRLLRIELFRERPVRPREERHFLKTIECCFAMRRKTLVNNLCAGFGLSREQALQVIAAAGLDERVRGEALDLEAVARVSDGVIETLLLK